MRRTHRSQRFAVKIAVVAVVAALAVAVDVMGGFKVSTGFSTKGTSSIPSTSGGESDNYAGAGGMHLTAATMTMTTATARRTLLNERGHLASAALHGGRGAEGTQPLQPSDDPCSGTTINAQAHRCAYVTKTCPNDEVGLCTAVCTVVCTAVESS